MITDIWFDAFIVIPKGKGHGSGVERSELRETHLHAADGWEIRETLPGVFSVLIDGMTAPVVIGGYGYSYSSAPDPEMPEGLLSKSRKGKR